MPLPAMQMLQASRSAAFSPLSIAWQSAFWAEDPGWSNPGDGNAVASWNNAGTDGTDATEATNQPLYRASVAALNNQPAIDFDGTNDILSANIADVAVPWTLVAIVNHNDTGVDTAVGYASSGATDRLATTTTTEWNLSTGVNGSPVTVATTAGAFLLVGYANGASTMLEVNGTAGTLEGSGETTAASALTIGCRYDGSGFFDGEMAFVGLIAGALSAPNLASLEAWATSHYGITIA